MRSGLRQRVRGGELTIGSWLSFGYPPVAEVMAGSGFDWLAVDMEHASISTSECQQLIQVIDLAGCVPLVRVGANDPLLIKRAMDAGAYGVIVPMVNSAADARAAASSMRYPPAGTRGVGLSRAQGYGLSFEEYRRWCEGEAILVVQVEHIDAVERIDEILALDEVDAFIVGPYDLSASLGRPGDFDAAPVAEALERVERAMRESGKAGGYHVVHSDRERLRSVIARGFTFVAYGDDMVFLAEKARDEGEAAREAAARAQSAAAGAATQGA
jgi:2-keto-3-deoxy-L-rhamnonate aldolase RhmA